MHDTSVEIKNGDCESVGRWRWGYSSGGALAMSLETLHSFKAENLCIIQRVKSVSGLAILVTALVSVAFTWHVNRKPIWHSH